jgi:histidyl-tRNA synthetase
MASNGYQPLAGMSDILPPEIRRWQQIEQVGRRILEAYGFDEIRTPILESTGLFERAIGDSTDVIEKEMYRFTDRGGRDISLRPEGTASVMRAVIAGGSDLADARLYYFGPMFRAERPQAGRKRQFHQLGAEAIGEPNPAADVECIALQRHILSAWGLEGFRVELNTRGEPDDGPAVAEGMRNALRPLLGELCDDCRTRYDKNVLRVLDCKNPGCKDVLASLPPVTAFMGEAARSYLDEVCDLLKLLDIEVTLNPRLVRGLDYYAHTVWEIVHDALGAQDALCGGGRYRFELGRRSVEGVGFAMGLERVLMVLASSSTPAAAPPRRVQVYIATQDPAAFRENLILAQALRVRGVNCSIEMRPRTLKKQMRAANLAGAEWVVIRGEQELEEGTFLLKNMAEGGQEALEMPALMERLLNAFSIR